MTQFTRRGLLIYPISGLTQTTKDAITQAFVDILQLETFANEAKMWDGDANFSADYGATGTHKALSFVCTPQLADAISNAMQAADGLWYLLNHAGTLLDTNDSTKLDNGTVTHGLNWEPDRDVTAGEVLQFNNQFVEVVQSHRTQADWTPDIAFALFKPYIQPGTAPQWRQPLGAHDAYPVVTPPARVTHNGQIYESALQIPNAWEPGVGAEWVLVDENGGGKGYPAWVQPTGAHDAYALGDKVSHNDKNWESMHDGANVWEPGGVGIGENIWKEIV